MDDITKNLGVLAEPAINPQQNFFGALTVLEPKKLEPNRDWTSYLGKYEPQSANGFDSQACVTFSALNCVEMLINRMIQLGFIDAYTLNVLKNLAFLDDKSQFNASDRFTAKISGTTSNGNYLSKVADSIANDGLVAESDLPFNPDQIKTFEDFYKTLSPDTIAKAHQFLTIFNFGWEWVGTSKETMGFALETSPLQVTVKVGSPKNDQGFIFNDPDRESSVYGHAVSCYAQKDYWAIFDHYANTFKKYDLSYKFGNAVRFFIELKKLNMPARNPLNLPNNCKVFVMTATGFLKSFYMGSDQRQQFDDKMIVDDPQKIDDTWEQRNTVDGLFDKGHIRTISEADWNKYQKANFKGEPK